MFAVYPFVRPLSYATHIRNPHELSRNMLRPHITCILAALALSHVAHAANRPDTSAFESAVEQRLQKLKPGDYTERNVHFVSVEQGKEQGGAYAFRATIAIRDYGPGYPANRYYGQT